MPRFLGRSVGLPASMTLMACLAFPPPSGVSQSIGATSHGFLRDGVRLPDVGEGFVRARPGEPTRYGTPTLLAALTHAAADVQAAYPGTMPLRIGDLSSPGGGRHARHGSHRTGRDADVIFYLTDALGRSVRGRGWVGFERHGVARETVVPTGSRPSNALFLFDDARNWRFVRTLLADEDAGVQWIFCSRGIKARLLRYAVARGEDPELVFRASWVLHQPQAAHPHHDHFHVRVACSPEERLSGCQDGAPVWPWIRRRTDKPVTPGERYDDRSLVHALLSERSD